MTQRITKGSWLSAVKNQFGGIPANTRDAGGRSDKSASNANAGRMNWVNEPVTVQELNW